MLLKAHRHPELPDAIPASTCLSRAPGAHVHLPASPTPSSSHLLTPMCRPSFFHLNTPLWSVRICKPHKCPLRLRAFTLSQSSSLFLHCSCGLTDFLFYRLQLYCHQIVCPQSSAWQWVAYNGLAGCATHYSLGYGTHFQK